MSIYGFMLDGWDHQSTWGYDDGIGSLYAQLTRNGNSDDNGPDIWLTPPTIPAVRDPAQLARIIANATEADLADVHDAMNDGLDHTGQHLWLPRLSHDGPFDDGPFSPPGGDGPYGDGPFGGRR